MQKAIKWSCIALAVLLVGIQFSRPVKTNPAVDESRSLAAHTELTPEVAAILQRSCMDCHSNNTDWPWYSDVAPVSWFVAGHVSQGRKHLNFSEWARYDQRQADKLLDAVCDWVQKGFMPLGSYTAIHRDARLSDEDKRVLCEWAQAERQKLRETRQAVKRSTLRK